MKNIKVKQGGWRTWMSAGLMLLFAGNVLAQEWYVSAASGNDANTGRSWATAKKSIQAAIDAAAAGETIMVSDGVYQPIVCTNKTLSIQSAHGAFSTVIDANGEARRCADLGSGVSLVGFTLQNGRFSITSWDGGGGARGGILWNCIVRNNSGRDGGGVQNSECRNCLLYGNNSMNGGGAGNAGNTLYNCTIVGNTARDNGGGIAGGDCYNCIICGNTSGSSSTPNTAEKIWASTFYSCMIGKEVSFVDASNGDYRLLAGSPCIDSGNNSYVTGSTDLAGNARIANGKVDIGCFEYDSDSEPSAEEQTLLSDGLVAYWPFNGDAKDVSGNGNNGTVNGATLTADRHGITNGAYYFDGNDTITVADNAQLRGVTKSFTIATWVKYDKAHKTGDEWVAILAKGTTQQQFCLNMNKTRATLTEIGGSCHATFDTFPPQGEWTHVTLTFDVNGLARTYVNGKLAGLQQNSSGLSQNTQKLVIGSDQSGDDEYLYGALDELGIWNRALTAEEVSRLYAGEMPARWEDPNISIVPPTRSFGTGGGAGAIVVSGNGTWTASASASWITLNATSGEAGYPVAYTVSATTNVESRTGFVYVSGHVHTVTQEGLGGSITPENATFETEGGTGTIVVTAPDRMGWRAQSNCDWLSVTPTSGAGPGNVTFTVEPLNEVMTRQGTLTVAGETFTVFQYGRRMKISPTTAEYDYYTHVIPITVDALAITEWDVELKSSWISVVDGGNGKGSDLVTIAIGENPSWAARTGTVRIGTETFTVTQEGRTALEFDISPAVTTASVEGANGLIVVTATPDLPWSAKSQSNWLTVYAQSASGTGNGNVAYSAAPNSTLYERTGSIVVTPGDTNVSAKTHTVKQPAAISALSAKGYEFEAAGESFEVTVSLSDIVQWSIENTNAWLTVVGATNRVGPGTVVLQASPNETVYRKEGTVTIARRMFKVSQKARGVEVEYDTKLFGTDGGYDSISIHPDGQVAWTAVASDKTWITIFQGDSGVGDGEIMYIVSPYVGTGEARTGTITVGDKVVYITQRAYDLSIDPAGAVVAGNNGAGEFGVSAGIGDVWTAIVTEPWITLIEGYDAGTGSGVVRFVYTDNDTGKARTGKIIVAGEVYTLEQKARELVAVSAEAEHGGTVEGAGTYDLGATVTLTAVPDDGYAFSYWTGDFESMENPLVFRVDIPKSVTAVFAPLPIAFESVASGTNGVALAWNRLAWATHYLLYRGVTSVPSSATVLADLPNTGECRYLDESGEVEVEYWYWIEAEGVEDDVMSDPMTGKKKWGWPAAKDEEEVAAALGEAADARLGEGIASVEEYDEFRAWAAGEGREELAVRESEHAWPSYELGAEELFENEPVVVLGVPSVPSEEAESASTKRGAAGAPWVVSVTVKDGEKVAGVDAAKVAERFECTSDLSDWTGTAALKPTVVEKGVDGEALLFEVTPAGSESQVFLRIAE